MIKKDDKPKKGEETVPSVGRGQNGIYEVVWPCDKRVIKITRLAKRHNTLKGKTVCELWDYLFRGDKIFQVLEKELKERYPGIKFVNYSEFGSTHGGEEKRTVAALPVRLKEKGCDAVISSVGC